MGFLPDSEDKDTDHAEFFAPVQLQTVHHAEWQRQDAQIYHALKDARDQPETIVVDAIPGIGVAVLPHPLQGDAVQAVGDRGGDPERDDQPERDVNLQPEVPADEEEAVEEEQERDLGGAGDEEVQQRHGERDLGIDDILWREDVVRVKVAGGGRSRRGHRTGYTSAAPGLVSLAAEEEDGAERIHTIDG